MSLPCQPPPSCPPAHQPAFLPPLPPKVQKGLNDYLETKRLAFPRFYFLSNDELLEILSETKDPTRVQPFLRKIFEGINGLDFEAGTGDVLAMISEESERVAFTRSFNPKDSGGNVERWLIECEVAMMTSVKDMTRKAFDAYGATPRVRWVTDWPGQVVICTDCMYWTKEVAEAINKGALAEYGDQCTDELMKVVNKVRRGGGGGTARLVAWVLHGCCMGVALVCAFIYISASV